MCMPVPGYRIKVGFLKLIKPYVPNNILTTCKKSKHRIKTIRPKKKVQNSMILLINGKFAHYHLSGRSDDCKISAANNFMLDEAIRFALKKGCIFFHLGGGTTAIEKDPLFQFKLNFSQNKLEFYTGFKVYIKKTYEKVCKVWIDKNPDKKLKYKNYNLKYRVVY